MSKIKFSRKDDATSRLPFKPSEEYNNLCLGHLTGVHLDHSVSDEDKEWEFAGMEIPRIVLEFEQWKDKTDVARFYTYSEIPVTVVRKDGSEMKESTVMMRYEKTWKKLKHIYDSFNFSPNWKPLPFDPEFDPDGDVETRLKEWDVFFKKIADAFNKGKDKETPIFPTDKVKETLITMKLVANGNRLTFPEFTSTGFIEKTVFKGNNLQTLLEFKYNESITIEANSRQAAMPNVAAGQFATGGQGSLPNKLSDALE